jgi:hypothetical protein
MEAGPFAAAAAKSERLPGMHTSRFEPDPTPTLTTGIRALTAAAETLMPCPNFVPYSLVTKLARTPLLRLRKKHQNYRAL